MAYLPSFLLSGKPGLVHRVDKACLNVRDEVLRMNDLSQEKTISIKLTAELCEPYAVFLRSDV